MDLYTDDYRKRAYLDVHAFWTDRDLKLQHFGTSAHTGVNISSAVNVILGEYGLPEDDTPVTTDHGSNVVAALKNGIIGLTASVIVCIRCWRLPGVKRETTIKMRHRTRSLLASCAVTLSKQQAYKNSYRSR